MCWHSVQACDHDGACCIPGAGLVPYPANKVSCSRVGCSIKYSTCGDMRGRAFNRRWCLLPLQVTNDDGSFINKADVSVFPVSKEMSGALVRIAPGAAGSRGFVPAWTRSIGLACGVLAKASGLRQLGAAARAATVLQSCHSPCFIEPHGSLDDAYRLLRMAWHPC